MFSKRFFTGWVSVGILWLGFSAACVGVYPLWEGRHSCANAARGIWRDLTGRGGAVVQGRRAEIEGQGETVVVEKRPEVGLENRDSS